MKKKAVLLTSDAVSAGRVWENSALEKLAEKLDFVAPVFSMDDFEKRRDELASVEIAFSTWGMFPLTEEEIKKYLPSLKALFYAAGTVQYFAKPFIALGIKVFSAWAANAVPVAEFTVAEIVLAAKGYYQRLHQGSKTFTEWANHDACTNVPGNYGVKVGLIGIGMIGSLVAEMLRSYKIDVWGYDPFLSDEKAERLGIHKVNDVHELFSECFVISNHLANNDQTAGMLNKSCFDLMQKNATFINTGRGRQVIEADLIEAMQKEPMRVALLDVTYPDEPPKADSMLYRLPNVFLTPHLAGSYGDEVHRMAWYMVDEFEKYSDGEKTKYEVTAEMLKTMA